MENMLTHELVHAYDHCRCATSQPFDRRCENRSPPLHPALRASLTHPTPSLHPARPQK